MFNNFVDIVWKIEIAIKDKTLWQLNQVKWSFMSGMKDKRAGKLG
jgi:hypothetical protein